MNDASLVRETVGNIYGLVVADLGATLSNQYENLDESAQYITVDEVLNTALKDESGGKLAPSLLQERVWNTAWEHYGFKLTTQDCPIIDNKTQSLG